MKKKSQRFSFKKLNQMNRRQDCRLNNELSILEKSKQAKLKSSQKISNEICQRFKLTTKQAHDNRSRIRTEAHDPSKPNPNPNPHPHLYPMRRKEKVERARTHIPPNDSSCRKVEKTYTHRNYVHSEAKSKTVRKLHLNQEILKIIKNGPVDKYDRSLSGKAAYQSFRKPHDSHRSGSKKTALEDYVSSSLENLKTKKQEIKPMNAAPPHQSRVLSKRAEKEGPSNFKNRKLKNLLQENGVTPPESIKPQKSNKFNSYALEEGKGEKTQPRESREKPGSRELLQADSLQKFQIKFEKANKWDLSREELDLFGDRFPDGFEKLKLLGRGGFSLVWLAEHRKNRKKFAIKQIITESTHQTHIKEIWFGTYFFEFGGAAKEEFAEHPGIQNLVKLYYYFINKKDTWIVYEKCGDSLGNALYELKGEKVGNEKVYQIHHKPLYARIRKNQNQLRLIILNVAKALELLAENNIVHSDLKTENILVREKSPEEIEAEDSDPSISIAETKLIDYGSSFVFNNLRQFSMATPEYMAPEILNFILYQNELEFIHKLLDYVQKYNKPWVIDVWSLGCVVLEIVSGIPLWMSLKTRVTKPSTSEEQIKYGLFAVKGRVFDKIICKQIEVIQNLDHFLYEENYSGIHLEPDLRALLKRMLSLNPDKRISPSEIIDFLEDCLHQPTHFIQDDFGEKETISHKGRERGTDISQGKGKERETDIYKGKGKERDIYKGKERDIYKGKETGSQKQQEKEPPGKRKET